MALIKPISWFDYLWLSWSSA